MRQLERKSSSRISFPMYKWRWDRRYVSSYFCSFAWVDLVVGATVCGRLWLKELVLFFWGWQAVEDDQKWADDEKQLLRRIQEVQSKVLSSWAPSYFVLLVWCSSWALEWFGCSAKTTDVDRYEQVRVRLEDNFDTAGAVSELLVFVKDVHSYIDKCNSVCSFPLRLVPTCPLCSGGILNL
jgi:hypothetical protein